MRSAAESTFDLKFWTTSSLKRRELEAGIRNVDLLNDLRSEKGAQLDIEAYRGDDLRPNFKEPRSDRVGRQRRK
jgi:hypothetical protein